MRRTTNADNADNEKPWNKVVEPTVERRRAAGGGIETITTHPAFGQIAVSRTSGSTFMYGSDFRHHGSMRIRIYGSEQHRDLARDWYFQRREMIEVELSEAQWATFVSTPNVGEGACCTLRFITPDGEGPIPRLPEPDDRLEQFDEETGRYAADALAALDKLEAAITNGTMSQKQRAELLGHVSQAQARLRSGLPFIMRSFAKNAQTVIEKAKVEVSAYASRMVSRLGLQQLLGDKPLLELHDGRREDEEKQP